MAFSRLINVKTLKTSFGTFIVIKNVIWYVFNLLFGNFLESLVKFKVCSGIEIRRDSSYFVTHAP